MSMNIDLHNVSKITADVGHGGDNAHWAHWVDIKFQFKRTTVYHMQPSPVIIAVFFAGNGRMADVVADAINSVNRPHVAGTTAELMRQLRDSVALCDAERVP